MLNHRIFKFNNILWQREFANQNEDRLLKSDNRQQHTILDYVHVYL